MPRNRPVSRTAGAVSAPWGWGLAGALLGLVLASVVYAPARWLSAFLRHGSDERIVFDDARGTLWDGSARLLLTGGPGSSDATTLPGRLGWRIRPDWSGLRADLHAECCMRQAWRWTLQPRWGGAQLRLDDNLSQWPAQWLSGLGTPWNTVQAQGQLLLSTQGLSVQWAQGRILVEGRAQLDATHISSRLSTLQPMGSYRITLQGGPTPSLGLETIEGSLQLSGTGRWVGSKLRFVGVASAEPQRLEALSNLLNIIGRRDGARSIIKVG